MDLLFSAIFGSGFMFIVAIVGIAVFLNFVPLGLWISAIAAGVNVGIFRSEERRVGKECTWRCCYGWWAGD